MRTHNPNIVRDHPSSSRQQKSPDFIAVYYFLYTEDGAIEPKQAFKTYDNGSPSIARIDKNLLPPRHGLDAVIRCIAYVEGFSPCVWHQLFASIDSELPIDDLNVWDMQRGSPGFQPEKPLVFVKSADMKWLLTKRYNSTDCSQQSPDKSCSQ